jgi:hypothetical protein
MLHVATGLSTGGLARLSGFWIANQPKGSASHKTHKRQKKKKEMGRPKNKTCTYPPAAPALNLKPPSHAVAIYSQDVVHVADLRKGLGGGGCRLQGTTWHDRHLNRKSSAPAVSRLSSHFFPPERHPLGCI